MITGVQCVVHSTSNSIEISLFLSGRCIGLVDCHIGSLSLSHHSDFSAYWLRIFSDGTSCSYRISKRVYLYLFEILEANPVNNGMPF